MCWTEITESPLKTQQYKFGITSIIIKPADRILLKVQIISLIKMVYSN